MSTEATSTTFFFFLTLSEKLPTSFYVLDSYLKEIGFMLVPIKIDQLQSFVAASDQEQITIITSTMDTNEYKLYNEKVRNILKFILKSPRLTYIHLSSFSKLNDSKQFFSLKNYIFLKYPIDPSRFVQRLARHHITQMSIDKRWPGGKRAGVKGISI